MNTYSNVDGRLDPSSKSKLQELLLAEGKAKKRKFGPAKHESDNSASKLSRGLNDKILKQSRSGDSCEKGSAVNTLRQCDRDSQVVPSVEFDEYVFDTNDHDWSEETASSSRPDRDRLASSQSNPSRPSSSPPSWSAGDIVAVVVDKLDELILCRVVGSEKPCYGDPQHSCWRVQVFAAVGRRELKNEDEGSSCSRAFAAAERFVHAVFCIQHDLFLTVQAPHVVLSGIHLDSGTCTIRYHYHYHDEAAC